MMMAVSSVTLMSCKQNADVEQQVDELYGRMSQEERVAQLQSIYLDVFFDEQGKLDTAKCRELIPNGIGHFSQFCVCSSPGTLMNCATVSPLCRTG